MEFLMGLFVGLVWWQTTILVGLITMMVVTGFAESFSSIIYAASIVGVLIYLGKFDFSTVNYTMVILYTLGYLLIGILWSAYKWFLYVIKYTKDYNRDSELSWKHAYEEKRNKVTLEEYKASEASKMHLPSSSNKIEEISMWILFWELSMLSYVFSDLIKDIISKLGGIYNAISRYAISRVNKG